MRKTHLRVVVDEELGIAQTACGLRLSEKRPVTEYAEDITCTVCKQVADEYLKEQEEKAAKRKAKKAAKEKVPDAASEKKKSKRRKTEKKGTEYEGESKADGGAPAQETKGS